MAGSYILSVTRINHERHLIASMGCSPFSHSFSNASCLPYLPKRQEQTKAGVCNKSRPRNGWKCSFDAEIRWYYKFPGGFLIYLLATLNFTILLWLVLKRRDVIALLFLLGLTCYMLTGISVTMWSEATTIIFVYFGLVFILGELPSRESDLASIMILESQLRETRRGLRIVQKTFEG